MIKDLFPWFYRDEEVERVFSPLLTMSLKSARKIKDYVIKSKLYPVEISVGCWRSGGSRCQVCENIKITDTFTSFTTKGKYKINHSFDCNDNWLIYLFNWKTCGKQKTGKTTCRFRSRWNHYKSEARKAENGNMVFFYNHITTTFLKTWKLGWFIKRRALTWPIDNFTGWELLKFCILMVSILRVIISTFYGFTSTLGLFKLTFSFPGSLVNRCWITNSLRVVAAVLLVIFWSHCLRSDFWIFHSF